MLRRLDKLQEHAIINVELLKLSVLDESKEELDELIKKDLELRLKEAEGQINEVVRTVDWISNRGLRVYKHIFKSAKATKLAKDLKFGWDQGAYSGPKAFNKALEALKTNNPSGDEFILQLAVEQVIGLRGGEAVIYFQKYADMKHKLKRSFINE